MVIIPHNEVEKKYIEYNDSNISYKSSLLTNIYKNKKEYIISLVENDEFKKFMKEDYDNIKAINIYKELYERL